MSRTKTSKTMKKRTAEFRAEQVKTLEEKRGALLTEMDGIIDGAKAEVRAFTEEENSRIEAITDEVESLNATIAAERRAADIKAQLAAENKTDDEEAPTPQPESRAESGKPTDAEIRAVANYIRKNCNAAVAETRADKNLTMAKTVPLSLRLSAIW